jgi:hypothetical protein
VCVCTLGLHALVCTLGVLVCTHMHMYIQYLHLYKFMFVYVCIHILPHVDLVAHGGGSEADSRWC